MNNIEKNENHYLSAREAAAELSVSPATLYAYVSRGMIRSESVPGERAKRYRAQDVRTLREKRTLSGQTGPAKGEDTLYFGAPVLESGITLLADGEVYYRGVLATRLADASSFEAVATLLWDCDQGGVFAAGNLPPGSAVLDAVRGAGAACPAIEQCILALAVAALADEAVYNRTRLGMAGTGGRIIRLATSLIGGGEISVRPIHEQLADVWRLDPQGADLIRKALILLADHELNTSTFTVRSAVSTGANLYEGVIAGLAALKGPRHGGASGRASVLLDELSQGEPESRIRQKLEHGKRLAGFGHVLYPEGDPRAFYLLQALEEAGGDIRLTRDIPDYVARAAGVMPNIDYALAVMAHVLGLPGSMGIALFALGRMAGWVAHAIEQQETGRLIRARALYTGPVPKEISLQGMS